MCSANSQNSKAFVMYLSRRSSCHPLVLTKSKPETAQLRCSSRSATEIEHIYSVREVGHDCREMC